MYAYTVIRTTDTCSIKFNIISFSVQSSGTNRRSVIWFLKEQMKSRREILEECSLCIGMPVLPGRLSMMYKI